MDKKCCRCGLTKSTSDFYKNHRKKDGLLPYCKKCHRKSLSSVTKQSRRRHDLKRKYKLTEADYNAMWIAQGGACKICCTTSREPLHIDHNHKTGKIRGLLCRLCNWALGFARDNTDILKQAIDYLESNG